MIIAGILIALGATANLMLGGIAGAIFFSFGLLTICALEAKLYTGKIAYYFNYSVEEIIFMLIINCLSAGVMAALLLNTRIGPTLVEKAMPIVESKMGESYLSAFIMALMCGAIIYFAIELFKTKAYYGLILAIALFIICGFNHCIADFFYYSLVGELPYLKWIITVLGNSIGGIATRAIRESSF